MDTLPQAAAKIADDSTKKKHQVAGPRGFCCQRTGQIIELSDIWQLVTKTYRITELLGSGSYGMVVKGVHRTNGTEVAIKWIGDACFNEYEAEKLFREVHILRKMSEFKDSFYTVGILDIIIP